MHCIYQHDPRRITQKSTSLGRFFKRNSLCFNTLRIYMFAKTFFLTSVFIRFYTDICAFWIPKSDTVFK
nr:MAG TPA: hypothetical protein [Caudoviricetes sp.]